MIAFVIWLVLWPLSCEIADYVSIKRKILQGKELSNEDGGGIYVLIWIIVALMIYPK